MIIVRREVIYSKHHMSGKKIKKKIINSEKKFPINKSDMSFIVKITKIH